MSTAGKFKDFTLSQKTLCVQITEADLQKCFQVPEKKEVAKDGSEADFEMVEASSPFVEAAKIEAQKIRTENNAVTFKETGDARADFLFHVMEQTPTDRTLELLEASWAQDDLSTLKLLAHLRSVKKGKGIRYQYHECLFWLYKNHPKTLYENLEALLEFGYWKDALQMLLIVCFDGFVHKHLRTDDIGSGSGSNRSGNFMVHVGIPKAVKRKAEDGGGSKGSKGKWKLTPQHIEAKDVYNRMILEKHQEKPVEKCTPRKEMDQHRLKFARDKFEKDVKYRVFHSRIAQLFAKQLAKDLELVKAWEGGKKSEEGGGSKFPKDVSLAGKWAPSLEAHFDRYTLIGSSIAIELAHLLPEKLAELKTKSIPVAAYLARKMYHKEYCVPLRKFLEIPEVRMSEKEWDRVNYKRVASKCMKRNKAQFMEHDGERFENYIRKPESKVAGAALKPLEIVQELLTKIDQREYSEAPVTASEELEIQVLEKQWNSLVDSIKSSSGGGMLQSAISVCDVSGSMSGTPMQAAIGLTLITMKVSAKPWNNVCITFSEEPQLHEIKDEDPLFKSVKSIYRMDWGGTTNVHKVFELIVGMGKKHNVKDQDMPRILFIYTDMEWGAACPGTTDTNYESAKKLFSENGYSMPTVVFWNLRSAVGKLSTPVQSNELGVLLMSGFSAQSLSYIVKAEDLSGMTPIAFLMDIVNEKIFDKLKIYD